MFRSAKPPKRALMAVPLLYAALTVLQMVVPALGLEEPAAAAGASPSTSATTQRSAGASADRSTDRSAGPTAEQQHIRAARSAGCTMAGLARRATREANIPLYVGCAFLAQETGGGRNVFGSDPTVFAGAGQVTKSKYLAYKDVRRRTGEMQGVGPMQLTWPTYQDAADRLGGAWKPYPNMLVGFRHLAALHRASGSWTAAAHEYNGGGPAADAYAAQMAARFDHLRDVIG